MGLLLDDDEDCTHILKITRVESAVPTTITSTTSTANNNNNNNNNTNGNNCGVGGNHVSAPREIRRRGGNGIEKMSAFIFGAANAVMKDENTPPPPPPQKQQKHSLVQTTGAQSPESFSSSHKQNTEPRTVAKTLFCSSQTFSEATQAKLSTQNNSQQAELMVPLSPSTSHSSQGSTAATTTSTPPSANSVSRELFNEGTHTQFGASTLSTASSKSSSETVSTPRSQMKLSDFFTKMACTKKRE